MSFVTLDHLDYMLVLLITHGNYRLTTKDIILITGQISTGHIEYIRRMSIRMTLCAWVSPDTITEGQSQESYIEKEPIRTGDQRFIWGAGPIKIKTTKERATRIDHLLPVETDQYNLLEEGKQWKYM